MHNWSIPLCVFGRLQNLFFFDVHLVKRKCIISWTLKTVSFLLKDHFSLFAICGKKIWNPFFFLSSLKKKSLSSLPLPLPFHGRNKHMDRNASGGLSIPDQTCTLSLLGTCTYTNMFQTFSTSKLTSAFVSHTHVKHATDIHAMKKSLTAKICF